MAGVMRFGSGLRSVPGKWLQVGPVPGLVVDSARRLPCQAGPWGRAHSTPVSALCTRRGARFPVLAAVWTQGPGEVDQLCRESPGSEFRLNIVAWGLCLGVRGLDPALSEGGHMGRKLKEQSSGGKCQAGRGWAPKDSAFSGPEEMGWM